MSRISKLLIANRGEIACRVMATAHRMGIATVAVYSDADRSALHVKQADEAVHIGGSMASQSYLNGEAIIAAAKATGADAIHPGYGFLSENAAFAQACSDAGLIFVGPPVKAIAAMGDKAQAKALMRDASVPVVPGLESGDMSDDVLAKAAKDIGFPLLIKAAAGGGGRGMRRVDVELDFAESLQSARREAQNAFGDGAVLLEKLITGGRHIEVQVFGDTHGNIIHLGERDCSAQRRHQKVIEEAPSPFVSPDLRERLGQSAVAAARAVDYVGAGTVEFIVDQDGGYYFLEMNTRLQVEHPVTECITGHDLVEWQLSVAAGNPLPASQDHIALDGHAIEVRLYAEDPTNGFQPQTGRIARWEPTETPSVRIDAGIEEGDEVTPFYDPMVAKIITHGKTRDQAIAALVKALDENPLYGVTNNADFLRSLLLSEPFLNGAVTTDLIDQWIEEGHPSLTKPEASSRSIAVAAAIALHKNGSDWFRSTGAAEYPLDLSCDGQDHTVRGVFEGSGLAAIQVGDDRIDIKMLGVGDRSVHLELDGVTQTVRYCDPGNEIWFLHQGHTWRFEEPDLLAGSGDASDPGRIAAPVAGLVREIRVSKGDHVQKDQVVIVLEAMKMENALMAATDAQVTGVNVSVGDQASVGDVLVELQPYAME
ncbi:MAG: acetyl-CoA carboxylase biotin carboxylase subunit [Pseudomonadota bacterium]